IDGYFDNLIAGNKKLWAMASTYRQGQDDLEFIEQLTTGQRLLLLLGVFDSQVKNGGITQFIWNRPSYVMPVRNAIKYLDDTELLLHYDTALKTLLDKKDQWGALRD